MRVTCLQENLSRGLSVVGRAVATRPTLPITSHVLLSTEGSRLKLSATNLELSISCWIDAQVEEEGAATVPARLFTELVGSLPNEPVEMNLAATGRALEVKCSRNEAHIGGMDVADFPPIPSLAEGVETKLDPAVLRHAIARVVFAAASDESRPVLTGVYTELEGDQLTMAAADGFRLSVHTLPLMEAVSEKANVLIPSRAMSELSRLLGDQEEPLEVTISSNRSQAHFRLKNAYMVSQLMQGTFPNYSQLIPKTHTTKVVVELSELLRAIRTASIFARDGSGIVRIEVAPGENGGPGQMIISARAEEIGDHVGQVEALVEGEPTKIAFNNRYLVEVLSVLDCKQVALEASTASSPGVIRPTDSEDYTHVVMPMFVQW